MRVPSRPLALLLVAACTWVNFAYAARAKRDILQRIDRPTTIMTVSQARKALVESLGHRSRSARPIKKIKFHRDRVDFIVIWESADRPHGAIIFAQMENLAVAKYSFLDDIHYDVLVNKKPVELSIFELARFENKEAAVMFIDAVLTLKAGAASPDWAGVGEEEARFTTFNAEATVWLATTPKPEMPDAARSFKLLAEDAFKRKDFPAAVDAYCAALDKFPMWPEGHYNAALLAAEVENYELAAQHMRRYLVLAPDARDASAAKDKLLLWQLKAKQ